MRTRARASPLRRIIVLTFEYEAYIQGIYVSLNPLSASLRMHKAMACDTAIILTSHRGCPFTYPRGSGDRQLDGLIMIRG